MNNRALYFIFYAIAFSFIAWRSEAVEITNMRLTGSVLAGKVGDESQHIFWYYNMATKESFVLHRGDKWDVWLGHAAEPYLYWHKHEENIVYVMNVESKDIVTLDMGAHGSPVGVIFDSTMMLKQRFTISTFRTFLEWIGFRNIKGKSGWIEVWNIESGRKLRESRMDWDVSIQSIPPVRLASNAIVVTQRRLINGQFRQELRAMSLDTLEELSILTEIADFDFALDLTPTDKGAMVLGSDNSEELCVGQINLNTEEQLELGPVRRIPYPPGISDVRLGQEHIYLLDREACRISIYDFGIGEYSVLPKSASGFYLDKSGSRLVSWEGVEFDIWEIGEEGRLDLVASGSLELDEMNAIRIDLDEK